MRRMKLAMAALVALGAMFVFSQQGFAKAHSDRSCASCHVPHAAADPATNPGVPLWNPAHLSGTLDFSAEYYQSPTMKAVQGPPDGASKLCLSCHDGTYPYVKAEHKLGGSNAMGKLTQTHPVSFTYDAALLALDPELVDPTTPEIKNILDGNSKVQCTSCHDPHIQGGVNTFYLRKPYDEAVAYSTSAFCRTCHVK